MRGAFLALPAGDVRPAYLDYVAARWARPADNPRRADIATLVPLSLIDGTILDGKPARLVAPVVREMSDPDLTEAITICARDLTAGRPWEFGEWR